MRGVCAGLAMLLAGCDQSHAVDQAAIGIQRDRIDQLESRLSAIEERDKAQDTAINGVRDLALETYNAHESLRKTFNGNVDMDNKAKAAALTAAGGCGQERYFDDNGYPRLRNKPCTVKDLH